MLEVRLKKSFPTSSGTPGFLLDIQFRASDGMTVLFGPSGSGKSLTLDLIAGFSRADEGRLLLSDRLLLDVATGINLSPQDRRCGYVFQRTTLFPHLTLRQNLELAGARTPKLERHRRIASLLESFALSDLASRYPEQLSGGQRQRGGIARSLMANPSLLLLDEASNGLDAARREELYQILQRVRDEFKIPILLVTHDLDEAFLLADQMLVLIDGKIVQRGSPREILLQPATPSVANLLGAFNLLPAEIKLLDPGNNRSRLRWGNIDVEGPYYPARLLGDRVTICVRRDEILAQPKMGKTEKGELVLKLDGVADLPKSALLHFEGGLIVEMPREEFADNSHHREWTLRFPSQNLRIL